MGSRACTRVRMRYTRSLTDTCSCSSLRVTECMSTCRILNIIYIVAVICEIIAYIPHKPDITAADAITMM